MKGTENLADFLSRGSEADKLINDELWWNGPNWLRSIPLPWRFEVKFHASDSFVTDRKKLKTTVSVVVQRRFREFKIFTQFSSYTALLRITALIMRFTHNLKKDNKITGSFWY